MVAKPMSNIIGPRERRREEIEKRTKEKSTFLKRKFRGRGGNDTQRTKIKKIIIIVP
jgi:hypothetical protein